MLSGTCLMPSAVRRTIGGMAKITVARMPGGLPIEKNATAGSRYTNDGMVCMMSRIGVTIAEPCLDFPTQIPSGRPATTQMMVAATTSETVLIAVCQKAEEREIDERQPDERRHPRDRPPCGR